jgi:hypothetical protein
MNGDPKNLCARCRVDRVTIELGGAVVLCLEPVGQAKSDQFVFDRPIVLRVPQIAAKATKDAAAEFVGRYFDVRISLVGDTTPPATFPGPGGGQSPPVATFASSPPACKREMEQAGATAVPRTCPGCGPFGPCKKGLGPTDNYTHGEHAAPPGAA